MRVLADGRSLTGFGSLGGVGTFSRHLFRGLAARPGIDLRVLVTETSALPSGVEPVRMHRRFDDRRPSMYEHEARLPVDLLRHHSDVVYSPDVAAVAWTRRPYVQTLHDVIPLVVDDPDIARQRKWWKRWARRYRRADAVVAVSRHSADEGVRLLALDPSRVEVIPNGVGPEFLRSDARQSKAAETPYLLTVGEYAPRKQWEHAFAVTSMLASFGCAHWLQVAGRIRPRFVQSIERSRAAAQPARIDLLGFVDDLPALYAGAAVYLSTSRYEGFGLPLVEAMASGTPVVTYDNSSLAEVVGDAGIVVPDGDVVAMADAVRRLLASPAQQAELREAGRLRAKTFSWQNAAERYDEVLKSVV